MTGAVDALWHRKRLILALVLAITAADLAGASFLPKRYSAEAIVEIEDRSTGKLLDGENPVAPLNPETKVVEGQVTAIRSPASALLQIRSLSLDRTPEFRRLFDTSPLAALWNGLAERLHPWIPLPAAEARRSPAQDQQALIDHFLDNLDVAYEPHGYTLRIRYRSSDPAQAAAVANAVARAYVESEVREKADILKRANAWYREKLPGLRAALSAAEDKVASYRQEHQLDGEHGPSVAQQQLSDLNTQLTVAVSEHAQAVSRFDQAQEAARSGMLDSSPDVMDSPVIQALREENVALERQAAQLSQSFGERYPKLAQLRAATAENGRKIHDETVRILAGLKSRVDATLARKNAIAADVEALRGRMSQENFDDVQLDGYEREAQADRALLDSYLQKAKATDDLDQAQRSDVRIVSPALVPGKPASPDVALIGAGGFVCALALATALALLLEQANGPVRSMRQAEHLLGMGGLGWLPLLRRSREAVELPMQDPFCPYSEALRSMVTRLQVGEGPSCKVMLVGSAAPDEGKSTFALSYARTLALSGKKCLLVDGDLRKPSIAQSVGAQEGPGFCDVLAGSAKPRAVTVVDRASGLHVMPAGDCGREPLAILGAEALRSTIGSLRKDYDAVVIDAPPVLAVSDAFLLAERSDLVVLVIRAGKTPACLVRSAAEQLQRAGARSMTFVLTRLDPRRGPPGGEERYGAQYRKRYARASALRAREREA